MSNTKYMGFHYFTSIHLRTLIQQHKYDDSNEYLQRFFFKSGTCRFFRNGTKGEFEKYEVLDAVKLIPDDLVTYAKRTVEYDPRAFLKSAEFMKKDYIPAINFEKRQSDIRRELPKLSY